MMRRRRRRRRVASAKALLMRSHVPAELIYVRLTTLR